MNRQDGISLIDQVVDRHNLQLAKEKVRKNKGAPGVDGITVDELDDHKGTEAFSSLPNFKKRLRYTFNLFAELDLPKNKGFITNFVKIIQEYQKNGSINH